jgi:prepilin-type processing-associated H-X9-DG protein
MKTQKHMHKSDVTTILVTAVSLLGVLGAIGSAGRKRAKRAVCLSNLRQLTRAWLAYADENDGKIVNGSGGLSKASADGLVETPWVGGAWSRNWNNANIGDDGFTEEQKKQATQEGALWPLIGEERVYGCPMRQPYEFVNYSIVDAMNGLHRSGTYVPQGGYLKDVGVRVGETTLWIKNLGEIEDPPAAERMVFVGEGAITPDSFGTHYQGSFWWDDPPGRHDGGATVSWADGRASYLRWKGAETVERARSVLNWYGGGGFMPQTEGGIRDLEDFQRAVWGRLGYESRLP